MTPQSEPLDLEAIKKRWSVENSYAYVPEWDDTIKAMIAEIERLRTIVARSSAPLAWQELPESEHENSYDPWYVAHVTPMVDYVIKPENPGLFNERWLYGTREKEVLSHFKYATRWLYENATQTVDLAKAEAEKHWQAYNATS